MIENEVGLTLASEQFNTDLRGIPPFDQIPRMPKTSEEQLRLTKRLFHINEELEEAYEAKANDDIVGMADAMADIVYLALGICHDLGIPFKEVYAEIHRSNMSKERVKDASESKRGDPNDLKKGPAFSPADVKSVLQAFNADV